MPTHYPAEFLNPANFRLAWERVIRGSNSQYKAFFSYLFPSYEFAHQTILRDLITEIRLGIYQPSAAVTVFIPKPSRILRPITLLSLNDQVVYQAIANVIANKFYPSLRSYYRFTSSGAFYADRNSQLF